MSEEALPDGLSTGIRELDVEHRLQVAPVEAFDQALARYMEEERGKNA